MSKKIIRNLEDTKIFDYEKGWYSHRIDKEGYVWSMEEAGVLGTITGECTHKIDREGRMLDQNTGQYSHKIYEDGRILDLRTGLYSHKVEFKPIEKPAKPKPIPSAGGGGGRGESALFGSLLKFLWDLPMVGDAFKFVVGLILLVFVIGFLSYLADEYLMPAVGSVLMRTKFQEKTYPETKKIRDFTKAIKSDPNNMEKYFSRGKAYFWDSYDTDQRTGERYKYFWITNNIKIKWKAKNHLGEAISDFTKVIEKNPKFAPAYYYRGRVYSKIGESDHSQYDNAISDFTKAIELDPKYKEAYEERANAYWSLFLKFKDTGWPTEEYVKKYERDKKKAREIELGK